MKKVKPVEFAVSTLNHLEEGNSIYMKQHRDIFIALWNIFACITYDRQKNLGKKLKFAVKTRTINLHVHLLRILIILSNPI